MLVASLFTSSILSVNYQFIDPKLESSGGSIIGQFREKNQDMCLNVRHIVYSKNKMFSIKKFRDMIYVLMLLRNIQYSYADADLIFTILTSRFDKDCKKML